MTSGAIEDSEMTEVETAEVEVGYPEALGAILKAHGEKLKASRQRLLKRGNDAWELSCYEHAVIKAFCAGHLLIGTSCPLPEFPEATQRLRELSGDESIS
jgi:hypothetical protein